MSPNDLVPHNQQITRNTNDALAVFPLNITFRFTPRGPYIRSMFLVPCPGSLSRFRGRKRDENQKKFWRIARLSDAAVGGSLVIEQPIWHLQSIFFAASDAYPFLPRPLNSSKPE